MMTIYSNNRSFYDGTRLDYTEFDVQYTTIYYNMTRRVKYLNGRSIVCVRDRVKIIFFIGLKT